MPVPDRKSGDMDRSGTDALRSKRVLGLVTIPKRRCVGHKSPCSVALCTRWSVTFVIPEDLPHFAVAGLRRGPPADVGPLRRSSVVAHGSMLSRFVHKREPRRTEASRARRTGQEIAGIPTIARNSSVVFVTGNGSLGTSSPSRSQMGSHPSSGDHSSRRSAGTLCRTASLCRS